jgi:hypothetical protein
MLLSAIATVAVATTTLTLPTAVQAGGYPSNTCVGEKMKAASANCKTLLKAQGSYFGGGSTNLDKLNAALTAAATKMANAWSKAETKSLAEAVHCDDTTLSALDMQTLITNAVGTIVTHVTNGLPPGGAKCGVALLKSAGDKCAALLKAEAGYIQELAAGGAKRDTAVDKAKTKFNTKVTAALVGCPTTATLISLRDKVDDLSEDVITNTTVSPHVSADQFDTITPPNQAYEGTVLKPICAFNTPYRFFVKRGSVNKLVMYYQGGGACWDYNTCNNFKIFDQNVDPTGSDNPNNTTTGFGDLTNSNNPIKDWNIVFVSYCTGDIHFGDSRRLYGGTTEPITIHRGWHNARTAEKYAREHFVNPEEVVVTGSSAGAYGAFFNAPAHHEVWPDSKFTVLADAGNGVITPDFLVNNFKTWNFEAHLPTNISGVAEAITGGGGIPAYTKAVADHFPDTMWGHYSSSYDGGTGGQTGFYNVMLNPDNPFNWLNWWNASCAWNGLMVEQAHATALAVPNNYRYYIGTGSRHTMYGSDKVYTDTTGGVPTIASWLTSMLARDGGWTNVECSSDCGKLLPGDPAPSPLAPPFGLSGSDTVITCGP